MRTVTTICIHCFKAISARLRYDDYGHARNVYCPDLGSPYRTPKPVVPTAPRARRPIKTGSALMWTSETPGFSAPASDAAIRQIARSVATR